MKTPTPKTAKKKAATAKKTTKPESKPEVQAKKEKYSATIVMGGVTCTAHGKDESIFSQLNLPKVTYKCLLTVQNNENQKVFEASLAPFMAKKVLTNEYVQKFQWKRITSKIA